MEEEQINNSDEWLDEVDEMIFNLKRKVHSWLKEKMRMIDIQKLHQGQNQTSISSRRSSKSSSSRSSRSGRIEGKVKLKELLVQVAFLEKHQQLENEVQRLTTQEKLAKARARAQIFGNVELGEEQELQGKILGNFFFFF